MSGETLQKLPLSFSALPISTGDVAPEFRAVERQGNRRGLRLERFFWKTLKRMAERHKMTLGNMVEEISNATPESRNLASSIRVACAAWLAEENTALKKLTSLKAANAILLASPSPAFALSATKKILAYNPAFQMLVRRQLPLEHETHGRLDLRLALDLGISEIFSRIEATGGQPVVTGFVIGAGDRRYRAQLNVVRAQLSEADVLLAFVFG